MINGVFMRTVLFFILSPGIILTLPGNKDCSKFFQAFSEQCGTSVISALLHGLIFSIIFAFTIDYFLGDYEKSDEADGRTVFIKEQC